MRRPNRLRWVLVFLCLAFFALASHTIDRLPLWWDEGFSIYFAHLPTWELLKATAADVHPPAYYLMLQGWQRLGGTSPFMVRMLSAEIGLLTLPLLFVTGKKLNGASTGAAAALLAAFSPFLFHHARDARMYSAGITLGASALFAFWQLLSGVSARRWRFLLIISILLGLYDQYAFALLAAGMGGVILWEWKKKQQHLLPWLKTAVLIFLGFLPWVWFAWPQIQRLQADRVGGASTLQIGWRQLPSIWQRLTVGYTPGADWAAAGGMIFLTGLVGVGLISLSRRRPSFLVLTTFVLPSVLMLALVVQYDVPGVINPREARLAFPVIPILFLAAAAGLTTLFHHRFMAWGAGVLISTLLLANIQPAYQVPADSEEDYRPLISQMGKYFRPGDAVLATYDWQDGYLLSYAPRMTKNLYRNSYIDYDPSSLLGTIFNRHSRVWVMNYQVDVLNPGEPEGEWLNRHAGLAFAGWFGRSQAALFVKPETPEGEGAHFAFESGIEGEAFLGRNSAAPGDVIQITLEWQPAQMGHPPRNGFIHLGLADEPPLAQDDWVLDTAVRNTRAILIPLDIPPGNYAIYLGIIDLAAGNRLLVESPSACDLVDRVCLGSVAVEP